MTELIVISILVFCLAGLFYSAVRQHWRFSSKIETAIFEQAKYRGLKIKRHFAPTIADWTHSPFENEIKVGTSGFAGIPYNREYLRVIETVDLVTQEEKVFWVKVIRDTKNKLTFEWSAEANARQQNV